MSSPRYIVSEHPQGTDGWKEDRLGKVTGSAVAALYAKKDAAAREDYKVELVLQRLTGRATDPYATREMQWGTTTEPRARMHYEMETGLMVQESGFMYLPKVAAGYSPDGLVISDGRRGFTEFKCPKSKTHLLYLYSGDTPELYVPQVTHGFWVTGFEFCDFKSYDPRFPDGLQSMTVRIERDEKAVKAHEALVFQFLMEVESLEKRLRLRAA